MKRLLVCLTLALALALALALNPSPGWAAGNGNGNGNGNGHGNGNNGNNGNANGNAQGQNAGAVLSPGGLVTVVPDQNQALDARGAGALRLTDIADRAVAQWGGRVIDAKLIERNGALVYRLTMLNDQGVSRRVLYDARTGAPLRGP